MCGRVGGREMRVWIRIAFAIVAIVSTAEQLHVANAEEIWRGVDLSYVNELDDCGVVYRLNEVEKDPYQIFSELGANVVRLRLWHTPTNEPFPTEYSGIEDVKRGMNAQSITTCVCCLIFTTRTRGQTPVDSSYRRHGATQSQRENKQNCCSATPQKRSWISCGGALARLCQIGNEINSEMLRERPVEKGDTIDWQRQVTLVNAGLLAVRAIERQTGGVDPHNHPYRTAGKR